MSAPTEPLPPGLRSIELHANGHVRLVVAPLVEGAVAAAVVASMGCGLADVAQAAEEARGANKL